jgi:L-fuconolactonase
MSRLTTPAADAVAAIEQARSIVVLRLQDHAKTVRMGQILAEEGLRVMEVTLDHPDSVAALRQLDKALGGDVLLGAGTVRSAEQVRIAADAGARFCVSPHTDPAVVAAAIKAGLASIPGACTATEVATAVDAGAHFVKLFPAAPLGPGYLSALRGPFRDSAQSAAAVVRRRRSRGRARLRPDRGRGSRRAAQACCSRRFSGETWRRIVIVDAHLHLFRPAAISPRAVDTLAPADRDASVEELLELHRSFGVARAVMVPLGPEDGYLGEVLRRYPTRFAGVAVASSATEGRDPDADPVDDLMRRREAVPFHGLRALWLGDPARRLAESPMLSVLRRMQELGMVLWSYLPEEQLDLLDQLAAMMPDLPVVLNHFGFCPRAMQVDRLGRPWFKQPLPLQTLPKVLHLASYSRVHLMFSGQYAIHRTGTSGRWSSRCWRHSARTAPCGPATGHGFARALATTHC